MRRRLVQLALAGLIAVLVAAVALMGLLWARPFEVSEWYNRSSLERAGFERKVHDHDHGHITYFEAGEGPILVFVHGLSDQAGSWQEVAQEFEHFRVVVIDLPDHGDSPIEGDDVDAARGLELTFELFDLFADQEPITLIGNSLGGWVSIEYALAHPERVKRLVPIGSAGLKHQVDSSLLNPTDRDEARQMVRTVFGADAPNFPGFILDRLIEDGQEEGATTSLWSRRANVDYVDHRIEALPIPTDLVWGTEDLIMPVELGHRFDALLPQSRLHLLDGCGHVPQLGCPDELIELLSDILDA